MIVIEKGIPCPPKATRSEYKRKYPFPEMDVGDSFSIDGDPRVCERKLSAAASGYGSRNGWTFRVRVTEAGARCWRTA